MTFGAQLRMAGSVIVIASFFMDNRLLVNLIGLTVVALGTVLSVDMLERRIAALEPKEENDNEETNS